MQYKRTIYRKLGSDIFALVCFFQYDRVYLADPAAVFDIKVTQSEQFEKDTSISKVSRSSKTGLIEGEFVWEKCGYDCWGRVEASSENRFADVLAEEFTTCFLGNDKASIADDDVVGELGSGR